MLKIICLSVFSLSLSLLGLRIGSTQASTNAIVSFETDLDYSYLSFPADGNVEDLKMLISFLISNVIMATTDLSGVKDLERLGISKGDLSSDQEHVINNAVVDSEEFFNAGFDDKNRTEITVFDVDYFRFSPVKARISLRWNGPEYLTIFVSKVGWYKDQRLEVEAVIKREFPFVSVRPDGYRIMIVPSMLGLTNWRIEHHLALLSKVRSSGRKLIPAPEKVWNLAKTDFLKSVMTDASNEFEELYDHKGKMFGLRWVVIDIGSGRFHSLNDSIPTDLNSYFELLKGFPNSYIYSDKKMLNAIKKFREGGFWQKRKGKLHSCFEEFIRKGLVQLSDSNGDLLNRIFYYGRFQSILVNGKKLDLRINFNFKGRINTKTWKEDYQFYDDGKERSEITLNLSAPLNEKISRSNMKSIANSLEETLKQAYENYKN